MGEVTAHVANYALNMNTQNQKPEYPKPWCCSMLAPASHASGPAAIMGRVSSDTLPGGPCDLVETYNQILPLVCLAYLRPDRKTSSRVGPPSCAELLSPGNLQVIPKPYT